MEFEIFVEELPSEYPGIVPFLVDLEGDEARIEIYEGLEDLAQEYIDRFEKELFSREAFEFICNGVDEFLKDKPYLRDTYGKTRYYNKYMLTDPSEVNTSVILSSSQKMMPSLNELRNMTSLFYEENGLVPETSFVSVEDGKIVSVATVNDTESDSVLELTVNTCVECRGNGYGASNTASLAHYLLKKGYKVAYSVSNYNKASNKIAKKCGFRKVGRFYAVSAFKTDKIGE